MPRLTTARPGRTTARSGRPPARRHQRGSHQRLRPDGAGRSHRRAHDRPQEPGRGRRRPGRTRPAALVATGRPLPGAGPGPGTGSTRARAGVRVPGRSAGCSRPTGPLPPDRPHHPGRARRRRACRRGSPFQGAPWPGRHQGTGPTMAPSSTLAPLPTSASECTTAQGRRPARRPGPADRISVSQPARMKLTGFRGRRGDETGRAGMSPRRYELGKRQAVIDESRRRVLDAARALLAEPDGYHGVHRGRGGQAGRRGPRHRVLPVPLEDRPARGALRRPGWSGPDGGSAPGLRRSGPARGGAPPHRGLRQVLGGGPGGHAPAPRPGRPRSRRARGPGRAGRSPPPGLEVLVGRLTSARPPTGRRTPVAPDAGPRRGGGTRDAAPDLDRPRTGRAGHAAPELPPGDAVRVLLALTSFESFDAMAGPDRPLEPRCRW